MKCNEIIELFPDILKNPLQAAKVDLWETEEIRIRAGQCLSVRVRGQRMETGSSLYGGRDLSDSFLSGQLFSLCL